MSNGFIGQVPNTEIRNVYLGRRGVFTSIFEIGHSIFDILILLLLVGEITAFYIMNVFAHGAGDLFMEV